MWKKKHFKMAWKNILVKPLFQTLYFFVKNKYIQNYCLFSLLECCNAKHACSSPTLNYSNRSVRNTRQYSGGPISRLLRNTDQNFLNMQ